MHHTVGTNGYACTQVPAILRGIQTYHMRSNGWNDIGYNTLVDACGGVWEGRAGGVTAPIVGAHTGGFNANTTGVALIGTHTAASPTPRARRALARLLSWRLDVAGVDPTGTMRLTARSGDKFPFGSTVTVRAVSGHRDLFPTSCPGAMAYSELAGIARNAWLAGGPKVANVVIEPTSTKRAGSGVRVITRLRVRAVGNRPDATMHVRIERISTGEVLHRADHVGAAIDTMWNAPAAARTPAQDLRVVADSEHGGVASRPVIRPLGSTLVAPPGPGPVIEDPGFTIATPPAAQVVVGALDGRDVLQLLYTLRLPASIGAWLHDPASGVRVAELLPAAPLPAVEAPTALNVTVPADVEPGLYELRIGVDATTPAQSVASFPLEVAAP